MTWALILIVGNGYAANSIPGFTSKEACEVAKQVIYEADAKYELDGSYGKGSLKRFSVSHAYCIPVR